MARGGCRGARRGRTAQCPGVTMQACVLLLLVCAAAALPQRHTNLQTGSDSDGPQFVEEVVVESVLHVRSADAGRQARTNTQTNLNDGARVSALRS